MKTALHFQVLFKPVQTLYYLRYYGQNNMAETGFNAPMYLILLKCNATNKNSLYLYNFWAAFGVMICKNDNFACYISQWGDIV